MKIKNRWLVFFLIFPHLNIYLLNLNQTRPLTLVWQLAIVFVALGIIFKNPKVNKLMFLMLANMFIIFFSSLFHQVITVGIVFTIGVFIGFCIYLSYALKDFDEFITGLYYLSVFIVLSTFISLFIPMKNSYGEIMYFIGGKNQLAMTIVLIIPIIYMYSYTRYNKMKTFHLIIILIGILSTYIAGSGTGVVISILSAIFILLPIKKHLSYDIYLMIYVFSFFSIVIFRMQELFLSDFIVNYLGKDLTFTNRTFIWDVVIQKFSDSWFLGFGRGNTLISDSLPYLNVNEAHNGFLQIALETGLLGIISIVLIILTARNQIKLNNSHSFSHVLSFSIFAFMLIGLTESAFHRKEFWILLILACNLDQIIKLKQVN